MTCTRPVPGLRDRAAGFGPLATLLLLVPLVWLALAPPASATRYHVMLGGTRTSGPSTINDWSEANCYGFVRPALLAAGPADTVLLSFETHRMNLGAPLPALLANRIFDTEPSNTRLVLGGTGALVASSATAAAVVRGLTIAPADTGTTVPAVQVQAHSVAGAAITIEHCDFTGFTGNIAASTGGAAVNAASGTAALGLTLRFCSFTNCTAGARGGAVYAGNGVDLLVQGCTFTGNEVRMVGTAAFGGAVASLGNGVGGSLTVENSVFAGNRSMGPGGAIYAQDSDLVLRDTQVLDSRSAWGATTNWSAGAGVFARRLMTDANPVLATIERCRFAGNRGDLTVDNFAGDGGGVNLRGSDTNAPLVAQITDSEFEANFNAQGGGIYFGRNATGAVERCLFLDNTAFSSGGAAYKGGSATSNLGETVTFAHCVFAGNRAGWDQDNDPVEGYGFGGAVMVRLQPRVELLNCTFVDNTTGPFIHVGDAFYSWCEGQTTTDPLQRSRLVNCLFWGESGNDVQVRSDTGGLAEVLNCAWAAGEYFGPGFTPTGTITLAATPFAAGPGWHLPSGSALIDAGAPLAYALDFYRHDLPQGAARDVGAVERVTTTGLPGTDPDAVAALGAPTLRPAHPNPANPRTVVSFTLPRSGPVSLTVHDLAGRRLAVLAAGVLAAGEHTATWDGCADDGGPVASGLYALRLATGGAVATQKLMLVR